MHGGLQGEATTPPCRRREEPSRPSLVVESQASRINKGGLGGWVGLLITPCPRLVIMPNTGHGHSCPSAQTEGCDEVGEGASSVCPNKVDDNCGS